MYADWPKRGLEGRLLVVRVDKVSKRAVGGEVQRSAKTR
jgi:hypothetical protein